LAISLALAEQEGYIRIFVDEGNPMEELLQIYSRRVGDSQKAYVYNLLNAFKIPTGKTGILSASPTQPGFLIEPLTGREAEVLQLLAAGLSNQEIAEKLVLSVGTIKTHTHNLYGKLGVQSRTRALARAKGLNLI
jgi:LuxR family maltose regulon positive regulatory protein